MGLFAGTIYSDFHNSGALLLTLMQGLHELQQNEMSIEEYYTAFDCVIDLFSPWFLSVNKGVPAAVLKRTSSLRDFTYISFAMACGLILSLFVSSC